METDAKLQIQESIRKGDYELAWSFILDYENAFNPQKSVRDKVAEWKELAIEDIGYSKDMESRAAKYMQAGLSQADASHIACAVESGCDYFLTTDKKILNKSIADIELINPIDFVRRQENAI
jgi:predicted nucleic acid-binding protein